MDISAIQTSIKEELTAVGSAVRETLVPEILDSRMAKKLILSATGDSILPSVSLFTALAGKGVDETAISMAAGCQLFQLALWTHDAVIDGVTVTGWPQECMIINGDHIFSAALTLLSSGPGRAGDVAARMMSTIALGEIQYINESPDDSPEDYIGIIAKKYGSLFEACAELGGISGNLDDKTLEYVREYGTSLGMAYQIGDEILRLEELTSRRRMTLPVLYAKENDGGTNSISKEKDAKRLTRWCETANGPKRAAEDVAEFGRKALSALSSSGLRSKPMEDLCLWVNERIAG